MIWTVWNEEGTAIISDDAGQFNILIHGLCWVHAERMIARLIGFNDAQREAVEKVRSEIWALYRNNASERDIREYVKRRKISGGTRSDLGRQCRDTFVSLKKICRKLGVSFWDYLLDRVSETYAIPQLPELILVKALAPG